ncbi:hypothetical protein PIB30_077416 [Stylosanthes scabra]|uniref:Uncharacterized protein n=1 Tax=Stylosanthes scabra TaxID=79078 RepID=A0ABU6WTP8_9FABA|nr:hypothetical protein [Stylosanthes scabra]
MGIDALCFSCSFLIYIELGLQKGLDQARKLEIPILALIFGSARRYRVSARSMKCASLTLHSRARVLGRNVPETFPWTRADARGDRAVACGRYQWRGGFNPRGGYRSRNPISSFFLPHSQFTKPKSLPFNTTHHSFKNFPQPSLPFFRPPLTTHTNQNLNPNLRPIVTLLARKSVVQRRSRRTVYPSPELAITTAILTWNPASCSVA